ncbi:MAG TPA: hypothetical protein VMT11_18120 [Myxococcaceae bacterium]|nr:hypothetical protein [Myxococcaceae bacterium]
MDERHDRLAEATTLMTSFVERTGLVGGRPQVRYLWTDAFALCNLVGLAGVLGRPDLLRLAGLLVDGVHHTLGRHRPDDVRTGWISGSSEAEGEAHPTRGGLRIGKQLPERGPDQPMDDRREWDRDGQYFHYLTRWMHGLDQLARATREAHLNLWARELAAAAVAGFALPRSEAPSRLAWKMSIDLSRPLVASMGQHDALDGAVTCAQLRQTAAALDVPPEGPRLEHEERALRDIAEHVAWATADPLGIGGLLADAAWTAQLVAAGALDAPVLLPRLLEAALPGLQHLHAVSELGGDAARRLPFRELGLAIGLEGLAVIRLALQAAPDRFAERERTARLLSALEQYISLGSALRSFWRATRNQSVSTWRDHLDINAVMLATSLAPEGYLVLREPLRPGNGAWPEDAPALTSPRRSSSPR